MRIFYLCPDLTFPSGGIKRLYKHVKILNENGFNSYILHFKKGFKPGWFASSVPVVYLNDNPPLNPGDTIVVPEGFPNVMKKFSNVNLKRVVIALNPLYPFQSLPAGESWTDYGFNTVLASSPQIADLISWSLDIKDVHVFETSIDAETFYFDRSIKRNQIAYVSRKDLNTPVIEKILKVRQRYSKPFEFIRIENMKFEDYADVLRRSAFFITTSPYEGTNRSVLEAMASGCICTGYHGFGGKDYIIPNGEDRNFFLAETLNFFELAQILDRLVTDFRNQESYLETVRKNAIKTAERLHRGLERDSILNFWSSFFQKHANV